MTAPFPFDAWARPGKDAFEFWISFFPMAPLFGVRWRFADMVDPAISPFMQSGVTPFAMPFPDARAAGAAARPGEFDSPALADETSARPVRRTADMAGEAAEEAGRIAAEAGRAAVRSTATAIASGAAADPDEEADEKAEARLAIERAAETAVGDLSPAEAREDLFDAAMAAAPRPEGLLDGRPDEPDDLKVLKGIGAGLEKQLNGLGVWKLEQIARMSDGDLAWIDAHLTTLPGRCFRDDWIGQAKARLRK